MTPMPMTPPTTEPSQSATEYGSHHRVKMPICGHVGSGQAARCRVGPSNFRRNREREAGINTTRGISITTPLQSQRCVIICLVIWNNS